MFIFGLFTSTFGMTHRMINSFDENYFVYELLNFMITFCLKRNYFDR